MIHIELDLTNEGTESFQQELRAFLKDEAHRMGSPSPEVAADATRAYVQIRRLQGLLEQACERRQAGIYAAEKEEAERHLRSRPTVKQERKR